MNPGLTLVVTVVGTLVAGLLAYFVRTVHKDLQQFLKAVEEADQRSRDNTAILEEYDLIEQATVNHISRTSEESDA